MSKKKIQDRVSRTGEGAESQGGKGGGISRRGFLKLGAIGGCAAACSAATNASAGQSFGGWPDSYGMLTDFTKCVGCRSCEEACNKENGLPEPGRPFDDEGVFNEERKPSASAYTVVNRHENPENPDRPIYRKIQCNHCLEPACATACPIHAYTKTPEGAVIYDKDLCFGCRYCMIACPFYMPAYDYGSAFDPKIVKCVMCHDRIREGRAPACAEACPTGAVTFGKRDRLLRMARHRIEAEPERYINHIYGEHEAGGTSWLYLSGVPFTELGFPEGVPNRPMIELTRNYLDSVPMVFTVWPAIFGLVYGAMRSKEKQQEEPETDVQSQERGQDA